MIMWNSNFQVWNARHLGPKAGARSVDGSEFEDDRGAMEYWEEEWV